MKNVNKEDYFELMKFPVLYSGWECDGLGFICIRNDDDLPVILLSSHGAYYEAEVHELYSKVQEYNSVIDQTNSAIRVFLELTRLFNKSKEKK